MRVFGRALPLALLILLTPACVSHEYMGLSLKAGQLDPEIQTLARHAQAGDKQAQLDLGIRFEEGRGVPQNNGCAIKLYKEAARDGGKTVWVYAPSPGNGASTRIIPIENGVDQSGNKKAKSRLIDIEKRKSLNF